MHIESRLAVPDQIDFFGHLPLDAVLDESAPAHTVEGFYTILKHTPVIWRCIALMTGHAVLVGEMQDYVIRSQAASFSVALIAISVLMFLLLRSLSLGMLAMIPNLIPLLVGLGAMTLLGMDLNPGTVMITAVALGIVVDDTVHFMTALKLKSRETADISLAVEQAINSVGRPVVVTSVLLTLGFSVMLFGGFLPSRQIGGISALIIIIALLADLLLLPAALRLLPKRFLS
jgi:hypothetical protein